MSAQGYTGAPSGGGSGPFPISAITGLQAALNALTAADLTFITASALTAALAPYATTTSVTTAVSTALASYSTTTAMNTAISNAIAPLVTASALTAALAPYATTTSVTTAVSAALASYSTTTAMNSAIATALTSYSTTTAMNSAISTALGSYSTTTAMNTAIANALTSYSTTTAMNSAISTALSPYSTTTAMNAAIAAAIALVATVPPDYAFVGWTFDPTLVQAGSILATAGLTYVARIRATGSLVTNLNFHLTAGGATLTAGQCYATLNNDAGTILSANAVTADLSGTGAGAWGGGGYKVFPLVTAQAVTPGAWYRVRYWFNGTTGPTLSRAVSSSSAIVNAGVTGTNFRYSTADAAVTTLASAPSPIGTQTGGAVAHWVALS